MAGGAERFYTPYGVNELHIISNPPRGHRGNLHFQHVDCSKRLRRNLFWRLLPFCLLLIAPKVSLARRIPPVSVRSVNNGRAADLLIYHRVALRVRTRNEGLSPIRRATIAANRLRRALQHVNIANDIRISGRNPVSLKIGDNLLLYVTRNEAEKAGSSQIGLAMEWAAQIRRLITLPPIRLSVSRLVIPVGETRTVLVGGFDDDDFTSHIELSNGRLSLRTNGKLIRVSSHGAINGKLVVRSPDGEAACFIISRYYAGRITGVGQAEITGNPAPTSVQRVAILSAVSPIVKLRPHASWRPVSISAMHPIGPGQSAWANVKVEMKGGGNLARTASARVEIHNLVLQRPLLSSLLYSNNPERISKYDTLYSGPLLTDGATRLLYHHISAFKRPIDFGVMVVNPEKDEAVLQVISGAASPQRHAVRSGFSAGLRFFSKQQQGIGIIIHLPAGSELPLIVQRVGPGDVVSGIVQVRSIKSASQCYLTVQAWRPDDLPFGGSSSNNLLKSFRLAEGKRKHSALVGSNDVYVSPNLSVSADYTAGGHWTFISIGDDPVRDADGNHLNGNYGVTYRIQLTLTNPTSRRQAVRMMFDPGAGPAAGIFTVNGHIYPVPPTNPPNEYHIASIHLKPNEHRTVEIETWPLGGSSYPISVVVRQ